MIWYVDRLSCSDIEQWVNLFACGELRLAQNNPFLTHRIGNWIAHWMRVAGKTYQRMADKAVRVSTLTAWLEGWSKMRKRGKDSFKIPKKTYWHLYSLQSLESEKFAKVVNKILRKEYTLIK